MLAAKMQLYYADSHGGRQRQQEDGGAEKLTYTEQNKLVVETGEE